MKVCEMHWFCPVCGCPIDGVVLLMVCSVYSVSWLCTVVQMSCSACDILQVSIIKTGVLVSDIVPLSKLPITITLHTSILYYTTL